MNGELGEGKCDAEDCKPYTESDALCRAMNIERYGQVYTDRDARRAEFDRETIVACPCNQKRRRHVLSALSSIA